VWPLKCRRFTVFILSVLVGSQFVFADQIVLKNGDRVTGNIIRKDYKDLTIKTDQFGMAVTPWDQIESIITETPLNIVLRNGQTLHGTLTKTGANVEIKTLQATSAVAFADIAFLRNDEEQKAYERLQHPGWFDLWAGNASIGLAGTAGNSKTLTYTTSFRADRATNTDKTSLYFNAIKSSALVNGINEDTAQAVRGGIRYDHNAGKRFFLNVFNDDEYDRFQDLDLRFSIGGGLGFHALKTSRSALDLLAGMAYSHSNFSSSPTRNSAEFYWGDEYSYKLSSATSLTQSYRMFNDMTNTGDYRINFDTGLNTTIWKWLSWKLSLSDRYLSNPVPGRKTNDLLYTTGIGITFGT